MSTVYNFRIINVLKSSENPMLTHPAKQLHSAGLAFAFSFLLNNFDELINYLEIYITSKFIRIDCKL